MREGRHHSNEQEFEADLRRKQKNVLFEDSLANQRDVNNVYWHGNPDAPIVQRIGLAIVGLAIVLPFLILFFKELNEEDASTLGYIIDAIGVALGIKLFLNAFKRRKKNKS